MNERFINARDYGATGSRYETRAVATRGSDIITLDDVGDFKVGDEVLLSGGGYRFVSKVFFERRDTSPINPRPVKFCVPLEDRIEIEGDFKGDWLVYFIDIFPEAPNTFRWSKDYGRSWVTLPRSKDFIDLDGMARIRINDFEEIPYGSTSVFVFSDRLVTTVVGIEGNTLRLADPAEQSGECQLLHSDTLHIQKAIDAALKEHKSVFLPNGTYRLTSSLRIEGARSFSFIGESAEGTVIDNSLGAVGVEKSNGAAFAVYGGKDVNIENLSLYGNTSFKDRDICSNFRPYGSRYIWGFYFRKTNATYVHNAERVYIKNCHARRMSAECFYSESSYRTSYSEPAEYPYSIIYERCSVTDSARNAFNNNDKAEGTALINCRVRDIGGCAWEGASRFVKITGCYFRNAGSIAIGNVRSRLPDYELLPTGQHIITNNYFEDGAPYGGAMIQIGSWATQVIISNNVFTNFATNAISIAGENGPLDAPPENVIIDSNSIDMTSISEGSRKRFAVRISTDFVTVSNNHISVRGECDPDLTAITLTRDTTRINVHDNVIAGAGIGVGTEHTQGKVGIVVDETHFYRYEGYMGQEIKPSMLRKRSHGYRGWRMLLDDKREATVAFFDAETKRFELTEPIELHENDSFELIPPERIPIVIRANIIENCDTPLDIDEITSKRAILKDNTIY